MIHITHRYVCDQCGAERWENAGAYPRTGCHYLKPSLPDGWWEFRDGIVCPAHEVVIRDLEIGKA